MITNYVEARGARMAKESMSAALRQGAMDLPGTIVMQCKALMAGHEADLAKVPAQWAMTSAEIETQRRSAYAKEGSKCSR
jgi:hypothetical protein